MMLADMGADVISITRKSSTEDRFHKISERGKKTVALNLKHPQGVETLLQLCETADALIEGFRPGVAERLGIGPEQCQARNPKLVYGRMTGWGQTGPMANAAGHDINYIALTGALDSIGRSGEKPVVPLNLVGDFGGGGMFLAFGVLCAIHEASRSGKGQVVDVSMVEGTAALMHMNYTLLAQGSWREARESNLLDGGAHFYDTYETSDGKHIAFGSVESQFYQLLMELAELDVEVFGAQNDKDRWPALKKKLAEVVKRKTRDEWCEIFEGTDACFAPVLSMSEAPSHPHNKDRQSFIEIEGVVQAAPAPRFDRTPAAVRRPPHPLGGDTDTVLTELGYDAGTIQALRESGALT